MIEGWGWRKLELTSATVRFTVEVVLAAALLPEGDGRRRVSESRFSRAMENRDGWVTPSSRDRGGMHRVVPSFYEVMGGSTWRPARH
jgi:hypothetical protein